MNNLIMMAQTQADTSAHVEYYVFRNGLYEEVISPDKHQQVWSFIVYGNKIDSCSLKRNKSNRNFKVNNVPKALRALFMVKGYTFEC